MNRSIIIVVCLLTLNLSNLFSQDLRDNFIGIYQCNVSNCSLDQFGQYVCQDGTLSTLNFEKDTDTSQIKVLFADNSDFVLSKENDSTYVYSGTPYISVLFYSLDSVKLSRVHSSIGYSIYKGGKKPNSVISNPQNSYMPPYPNPFNNQINIENYNSSNSTIQILDLNGKIINIQLIENENNVIIETLNFSKGIYFLRVINSHFLHSYKMVKF